MTAQEMAYQFKLRANRIDSKTAPDLSLPQIVAFLNLGMLQLLKKRYGLNNSYRETLESIQKRIDEWQLLIVPHELLPLSAEDDGRFAADLTKTEKPYLFLLRASFHGENAQCSKCKFNTQYVQRDDLNVKLDNPNERPNFEWRRVLHSIAQNKLLAYTDNTFTLTRAEVDYLRYPVKIDLEGYEHFDESASTNVDCELPIFLHDDIVDEAVARFKGSLNHPDAQAAVQMAAGNE